MADLLLSKLPCKSDNGNAVFHAALQYRSHHQFQQQRVSSFCIFVTVKLCQKASVRAASISNISTPAPPRAISVSTMGAAASVRSPPKPAAHPIASLLCFRQMMACCF
jgi:hypothetical protein